MNKLIIIAAAFLPLSVAAQKIDRSKAPSPKPAPVINVADAENFTLANGLKVFVVKNVKLPRVTATLTVDRDPVFEGDKVGLSAMAGTLLRRGGTAKMGKVQLDEEIDFLGGTINTTGASASVQSLKTNFPKLMELFADVVLRPALSSDEFEKIRKQQLSALKSALNDPDRISGNVVNSLIYGKGHPYGAVRTEETIKNISIDDIKKYLGTYWKPNISYLVFVGDITLAEAKLLANKHFGKWQKAEVPKASYEFASRPEKTVIDIVDRPSAVQSVITLSHSVELKPGTPDVIPTAVMSNLLGGGFTSRLLSNLREKYGFTYSSSGSVASDKYVGNFTASAAVRNEKTDSAVGQFLFELNRLRNETPAPEEVSIIKNNVAGSFARALENPNTIASFALNTARYNLPKDYYRNYLKNLAAVTPQQIQMVARKYILPENMHIVIVGNAKQVAPGLEKYGTINYYDVYGNVLK